MAKATVYRPYFKLKNGQFRYGLIHETETEAWDEVISILDEDKPPTPEWAQYPCFIEIYGVDFLNRLYFEVNSQGT